VHKIRKFYTKFGYLILRIIIKFISTRHWIKAKCTKFNFGCCSAPDAAGEAYRAPQTSYLDLRGLLTSKGRDKEGVENEREEGTGRGRRKWEAGNEGEGMGRGAEGREGTPKG